MSVLKLHMSVNLEADLSHVAQTDWSSSTCAPIKLSKHQGPVHLLRDNGKFNQKEVIQWKI